MQTQSQGDPVGDRGEASEACTEAFSLACRYLGGRDLIEEIVATKYWPLYRDIDPIHIEKVRLPIMSEADGIPFPRFGSEKTAKKDVKDFVIVVEDTAKLILGEITDREYLARRTSVGSMPRLNRVFEEMGIHYYEREVPAKVREHVKKKVKEKAEKGEGGRSRVAKATTAAESRKRKSAARDYGRGKKQKDAETSLADEATEVEDVEECDMLGRSAARQLTWAMPLKLRPTRMLGLNLSKVVLAESTSSQSRMFSVPLEAPRSLILAAVIGTRRHRCLQRT